MLQYLYHDYLLTDIHTVKEVQALAALCCKKNVASIWDTFARKFITPVTCLSRFSLKT
jgi:hypothetical protein